MFRKKKPHRYEVWLNGHHCREYVRLGDARNYLIKLALKYGRIAHIKIIDNIEQEVVFTDKDFWPDNNFNTKL